MTALLWLRRDLRLHDHPALRAALDTDEQVVPVFCFDNRLIHGRHSSSPRTQFLLQCLEDLDGSMRRRGGGLVTRHGHPERVLPDLARELNANHVFWTADVGPFARARDERVRRALCDVDAKAHSLPGTFVIDEPAELATHAGGPYTVFAPFYRLWLEVSRREVLAAPRELPKLPTSIPTSGLPELDELGLGPTLPDVAEGGERAGRRAVKRFIVDRIDGYASARDELGDAGSSRLSPYLHFGCISPRELEAQLDSAAGPQGFRRQLCWRDFYAHIQANFPTNARHELQPRYRGTVRWSRSAKRFEAWREGRTGYPLVDAAMRQLRREGWIHNRARLLVGSFLTKDLGLDWRWGEGWFMRLLIDGDQANNNGNWQWIASVGVDRQPPARRVYNPSLQLKRLDPSGTYVRRYVPELANVPDEYLAEPWTMPRRLQEEAGCVIGKDYPRPIVDHTEARRAALDRYARARARGT